MIEQLKNLENLDRTEVYNAIYTLFEVSTSVKVYRCHQDYSGNYDELYNAYATFNTKQCEQGLVDYFLDNVFYTDKTIEHVFYIKEPVTTFLKYEALKMLVAQELGQKAYVTLNNANEDFIVLDGAVIVLDVTNEGAITGGKISTMVSDVKNANLIFNKLKENSVEFLKQITPETTMANSIKRKIKELKSNLK